MPDNDPVFKALADPVRRLLLDLLFEQGGRSAGELTDAVNDRQEMTRFGVAKHLRLLEAANLVFTRKQGRSTLHYLNAVPIEQIHRCWIGKYTERAGIASVLLGMKEELERAHPDSSGESAPAAKDES